MTRARAEKVAQARQLRTRGLKIREIAELMGAAISTVSDYLNDPTREKHKEQMRRRAGTCVDCGAPTDASHRPPAQRCQRCAQTVMAERAKERGRRHRERIEQLWAQGKTKPEIERLIGSRLNISSLRSSGYSLPYRRPLESIARMRTPGGAERMAYARSKRNQRAAA